MKTEERNMTRKDLTNTERQAAYQKLLRISRNGKLPHGSITQTAQEFNVSRLTIHRLWKRGQESSSNPRVPANVNSRKFNSGSKRREVSELQEKLKALSIGERTSLRRMETKTGISKSSLHRAVQAGEILSHSSSIKPLLTGKNELNRVKFALDHIHYNPRTDTYQFNNLLNYVHVDEKWFRIMKDSQRFYLTPDEDVPHRTAKSKSFVEKVMFLCAIARPRYNPKTRLYFDGKIGIWPFISLQAAKRNSKNRPAGTMEMKPLTVTREVYTSYLVEKVFPAIRSKFPVQRNVPILVQQDNARPHINPDDPYVINAGLPYNNSSHIRMVSQPANSPDFNVLDLGFFNSIQSLQNRVMAKSVEELVAAVNKSFEEYPMEKIANVFLTLQTVFESSMAVNGGNNFKIQHKRKNGLTIEEKMNFNMDCNKDIYKRAYDFYEQQKQ